MPNLNRSCTNLKINAGNQNNEKNGVFSTFSKKCYSGVSTTYYSSRLNNNNLFYAKKHETICMSEKSRKLSSSATLSYPFILLLLFIVINFILGDYKL